MFPAAREEIAGRTLDGGLLLIVPIRAQDRVAPLAARERHPDLLDRAFALDVGKRERRARLDDDVWRYLPALAEPARGLRGGSVGRHAAFAFFAGEVFRTDRSSFRFGQPRQVAQVQAEP